MKLRVSQISPRVIWSVLYVYIDILTLANTEVGFSHACLHKMCFPHLHYTKVIILCQSNIYCNFFFLKLLRMSPLTMWLFQLYPCLQEAMWIKKRQKIGTMHCSWWEASSSLPSSKDRKEESPSQCLHISLTSAPLFKGSFALLPQEVCHQRWFSHSNKVHALLLS